ncbi:unnamed protein product [Lymnaea stagnalis]|uniref:ShKT domain-containing protein n=1 Tax=Lymnaea stagnalis TaxID=6523 RepID=A0AAV2H901_LYMST
MFPCGNTVLKRCNSTREAEHSQVLETNCDLTREYQLKLPEFTPDSCEDKSKYCHDWAKHGECEMNPSYMQVECRSSCQWCGKPLLADPTPRPPPVTGVCADGNVYCTSWADLGECDSNSAYMKEKCKKSCGLCVA